MPDYFGIQTATSAQSEGYVDVLAVEGASQAPFAKLIISNGNDGGPFGDHTFFELRPTGETDGSGNNFVWIIAKHSGMALTVPLEPRFDQGAQVYQEQLLVRTAGEETQKWLQYSPSGGGDVFTNKWSAMALDVKGGGGGGTPVIQWPETGNLNQQWYFRP